MKLFFLTVCLALALICDECHGRPGLGSLGGSRPGRRLPQPNKDLPSKLNNMENRSIPIYINGKLVTTIPDIKPDATDSENKKQIPKSGRKIIKHIGGVKEGKEDWGLTLGYGPYGFSFNWEQAPNDTEALPDQFEGKRQIPVEEDDKQDWGFSFGYGPYGLSFNWEQAPNDTEALPDQFEGQRKRSVELKDKEDWGISLGYGPYGFSFNWEQSPNGTDALPDSLEGETQNTEDL